MDKTILIVDDEDAIRELIRFTMEKNGYRTIEAADGEEALRLAQQAIPSLMILDLMLPNTDGMEVCRRLKMNPATAGIPIVMLTAKDDEIDKVLGLEMGADDYMTKPFSTRELAARVKAVLRRGGASVPAGELCIGNLRFDLVRYEAYLSEEKLSLTPKEYELLKFFVTHIDKVYTRDHLLEKIWGYEYFGDTRTVDVHVRHLRAKLSSDPQLANAIVTVRGVGYSFRTEE
ncbi:MAG: response regulator transcription factor [Selenomonadales bacterium]|nr:response regulator transcription factor [Selenomonadales bacterium]